MQSPLISLVLLLPFTYVSNGINFNCSVENFQQCMVSLQAVTQSEKLAFAATKEELTDVCQQLQDGIQCVDDHTERCFSSSQQHVFNSVVSGSRQVIEDLCVSGPVQEQYLRYAQCFKNVSTDERKCASKYRRIVLLGEVEEKDEDVEEGLKKTCWYDILVAFTEFVHCKYTHAVRDCGEEAGVFLQRQQEKMSGSLIHQHCALYTYGTDTCSKGCLSSETKLWTLLLGFILVSFRVV